jgi:hypothetical protein
LRLVFTDVVDVCFNEISLDEGQQALTPIQNSPMQLVDSKLLLQAFRVKRKNQRRNSVRSAAFLRLQLIASSFYGLTAKVADKSDLSWTLLG